VVDAFIRVDRRGVVGGILVFCLTAGHNAVFCMSVGVLFVTFSLICACFQRQATPQILVAAVLLIVGRVVFAVG